MADGTTVEAATVDYQNNVSFVIGEKPGKLYPLAGTTKNYAGAISAKIDNEFDDIDLQDKTTKNGDTNNIDPNMRARFIHKPGSANIAPLIDRDAQKETSVDLASPVVTQTGKGVTRYHDDKFMLGFWGDGYTGENGMTRVPFRAGNRVPIDFGSLGSGTGVTKKKLVELRRVMENSSIDFEESSPIILLDPDAESDLFSIEEYIKLDYGDGAPLSRGEIKPWLGFRFMKASLGNKKAYPRSWQLFNQGGINRLPVFLPEGLHRGVWTEFFGRVTERDDKQFSWQFYAEAESAVVRVKEELCWYLEAKPVA
ncbi:phage capsid protein [Sphingomonas hankookensis]|uniref:phage capsid protein n=1 Tax=Sphingomonas hankookensis TaxID=563996 RepID=UPI001F5A46B3|nr:phage capsid protein [Sphingomonas hankookensis]